VTSRPFVADACPFPPDHSPRALHVAPHMRHSPPFLHGTRRRHYTGEPHCSHLVPKPRHFGPNPTHSVPLDRHFEAPPLGLRWDRRTNVSAEAAVAASGVLLPSESQSPRSASAPLPSALPALAIDGVLLSPAPSLFRPPLFGLPLHLRSSSSRPPEILDFIPSTCIRAANLHFRLNTVSLGRRQVLHTRGVSRFLRLPPVWLTFRPPYSDFFP
jgi:hypothetical protein